jgi:hypothetical protein
VTAAAAAGRLRRILDPREWAGRVHDADERSRRALWQISRLRERVAALELEINECRTLNKRLTDVIDGFVEVLVPDAHRDPERLARLLTAYQAMLQSGTALEPLPDDPPD